MTEPREYAVSLDEPVDAQIRLMALVEGDHPLVDDDGEELVMTFPHLLLREGVAFLALTCALVGLALLVDAPLETIADPHRTPNPSKAPWYFLGLQELLHYYPPVVAGVLLPIAFVLALTIVPYAKINLETPAPWVRHRGRTLAGVWVVAGGLTYLYFGPATTPAWPLAACTWFTVLAMTVAALIPARRAPGGGWWHRRSIPFWIFSWALLDAVVLTVIGLLFRGPGWAFTLPWREGVFL